MDHNELGNVTEVAKQGTCGSCWAFAVLAAMESKSYMANPHLGLQKFSEQHVLDCNILGYSCAGGWTPNIIPGWMGPLQRRPILEKDYPYEFTKKACRENDKEPFPAVVQRQTQVYPMNSTAWRQAVDRGPIFVHLSSATTMFRFYKSGIINDQRCFYRIDHALLLVGYGIENEEEYWIFKNSWGAEWGEKGYVRIGM